MSWWSDFLEWLMAQRPKNFPPVAKLTLVTISGQTVTISTEGTTAGAVGKNRQTAVASPITSYRVVWGDDQVTEGTGTPPATFQHTYGPTVERAIIQFTVRAQNTLTAQATLTIPNLTPTPPPEPPEPPAPLPPTLLSITRLDPSPTFEAQVRWQAVFSEPVTGVALSNFQLVPAGITNPTLSSISGSERTYIITAATGITETTGLLGLNLKTPTGITSQITGQTVSTESFVGEVYATQAIPAPQPPPPAPPPPANPPTCAVIQRLDANPVVGPATVRWLVQFSESVVGVDLSKFTLAGSGVTGTLQTCTGNGANYTVTVLTGTPAAAGATLGLNLTTVAGITSTLTGLTVAATRVGEVYTVDPQSTPTPPPPPPPPPPTPTPTPSPTSRTFLGGWRLSATATWQQGAFAIDFNTMRLWVFGGGAALPILVYDLPAMGGTNPATWPLLQPVQTIARWWPGFPNEGINTYCNGLVYWQGQVWAAPRVFYTPSPSPTTGIYAQDGQSRIFNLPRQIFAGFVKRGPGLDPLLGCGGYESGQGSVSGPTLADLNGNRLIEYQWPALPGPLQANGVPLNWNLRAPRPANYSAKNNIDDWVAWVPRTINGVLEGRWASDVISGGGLVLPDGITYWPWLGTGDLDYARQRVTFCAPGLERTYQYRYNATTYQFIDYTAVSDLGHAANPVFGQELGPDGKVYLSTWHNAGVTPEIGIRVYG